MSFPQLVPPHCAINQNLGSLHERDFYTPFESRSGVYELINQLNAYYGNTLLGHEKAMAFLGRFHIDDQDLLQEFSVGFSDRTLGKQLPASDTVEGELLRGKLQRMGFFTAFGGESLRGCLTFPFKDNKGDIVEIYGERFTRWLRFGTPNEVIWSLENGGLFNSEAILSYKEIILCATPLEALMFVRAGFHNVVATMGSRGFTVEQLDDLVCAGVARVLIAFESAPKADQSSYLVSQALNESGIECLKVAFPAGCGARDLVPSRGLDMLRFVIQGARPCCQSYEAIRSSSYDD
ncbi:MULTISPECIES: hypothetical protein [unclassified Neptuniibacter]|uniref:hypothetical protein n=1 Tax=unclassified Neptuniibacter TaxID=2630693 RepID=UPI000C67B1AE|nr:MULTISPECIES: hypothetical protein [unclassified Neptuniibacter]MAY42511.1 hypothetical protein [Oceanospirillaceae bacterium]|tara:strand:+ start:20420 stop:21298 length:879 start_codon:yes stop_codon:yes gene_type:complete